MNAITEAFIQAGVPAKPLRHRVWQIIKDTGPITIERLTARLCEDRERIRQTCNNLRNNGQIESGGRSGWAGTVSYTAIGQTYEDSLTYKRKPTRVTAITPTAPATMQFVSAPPAKKTTLQSLPEVLEGYTIRELRELRDSLNAMFE